MIYYFSGTGNSRFVATELARLTNDAAQDMTCTTDKTTGANAALLGFVFPVYGWQPPKIVRHFVAKLAATAANGKFVYTIMTCGDDTGKTLAMFEQMLHTQGIATNSAYSVLMPDVYVCLPGFDVDTDTERHKKYRLAAERIRLIAADINARRECRNVFEGIMPRTKTYLLGTLFYKFLMSDTPFRTNENCTGCGMCEKECPAHNIRLSGNKPVWGGNCEGCLNCYHSCPRHAIDYGRQTKRKGQYTFARHSAEMKEIMKHAAPANDETVTSD